MATFLFDKTIFGPVFSRRLGSSLGINLLPNDSKICSFDCIYCECGWNPAKGSVKAILPSREDVKLQLYKALNLLKSKDALPDVITFAGNGEPTLHPDFDLIIEDTLQIRNEISPKTRIAVLSNATMLHKIKVIEALKKIDDNIQKLDSGISETIRIIDQPVGKFNINSLVGNLKKFDGKLTIQTMFLKGSFNGKLFDNTTNQEVSAWISLLHEINPRMVMIYTIARDTPVADLVKIPVEELERIANRLRNEMGIDVQVSG